MAKVGKTELVKARVSKPMKYAVTQAAAAKGGGEGEAEASVIREALAEYFTNRGVDISDDLKAAQEPGGASRKRRNKKPKHHSTPAPSLRRRAGARTSSQADTLILHEEIPAPPKAPRVTR